MYSVYLVLLHAHPNSLSACVKGFTSMACVYQGLACVKGFTSMACVYQGLTTTLKA